ncbi:MAG: S8 family serine peptidase, partial [Bacteroidota bacterium]
GIDYRHPDFGYNTNDPVVKGGWDFELDENIFDNLSPYFGNPHGTQIAGIIGAVRNNGIGVAGIAGGDRMGIASTPSSGVSLYSLKMHPDSAFFGVMSDVCNGIESTSIPGNFGANFGLHVDNFSWGIPVSTFGWSPVNDSLSTNINLLRQAVRFANRENVVMCAARGNSPNSSANPNELNNIQYPAMFHDDWILSVGGSGSNGRYAHSAPMGIGNGDTLSGNSSGSSQWGSGMDFIAPSNTSDIFTTIPYEQYGSFEGTSAATPHVAGLVALMLSYHNSPIDSYQNLSQEDCESIIQMTCDLHPDSSGYSQKEGHGRINAGKAMRLIQKPIRQIKHFGNRTSPSSISITPLALQEIFTEELYQNYNHDWFPAGVYIVKPYKIDCTVQHSLQTNDSIITYWPRPSGSTVFSTIEPFSSTLEPIEKLTINSLSNTSASMTGYHYQVFDLDSNFLGWWPQNISDTSLIKFEYSILVEDTTAIDETSILKKNYTSNIELFPNPSKDKQTINITNINKNPISIRLIDFSGRVIKDVYKSNYHLEKTRIDIDISNLAPSIYYYEITIGEVKSYVKAIKQ